MERDVNLDTTSHLARGSGALLRALDGLQEQRLSPGQLSRVAVDRDGALHIEAEAQGSQRWFRFNDSTLAELRPHDDRKIPLLKKLGKHAAGQETSLLSYRPGRRVVIGLPGAQRETIVKGYRRRGSEHAANRHEIAAEACCNGGFVVPRLLEHAAEDESLVMARHCGSTPRIGPDSAGLWAEIGICLRRFQSARVSEYLAEFSARDELKVLDEQARRFLLCIPVLPENWQLGLELLTKAAAKLPPSESCLAHRDLHDGQFLTSGHLISLLDFDLLCKADAALDAGNLLAHIALRELQSGIKSPAASVCSQALLAGLARQNEPGFKQRLLFYQATSFYRLALLYALRPRWAHIAVALTSRGRQCLDHYFFELE